MQSFTRLFGRPPVVVASAPGRVNLIGEHTDYNGGFVLPSAIPQRTTVECAPADDGRVRVASSEATDEGVVSYMVGAETPGRGWLDYVQGTTAALGAASFAIGGFYARITSNVPVGSGLSSSAALEVSLLRALRGAFALGFDDVTLAGLGQRAETDFVGARVGIMDQMASSLCEGTDAIFVDTQSLAWERVAIPRGAALAVVDSGITHRHASGDYNTRRAECERAASRFGVASLRELSSADEARFATLPDPLGRRVRHVVTENERVVAAVAAMRANDPVALGRLFGESHASMRDDYQVSLPEIDRMVEIAVETPGVFGARLTGGGFGGSIVVLADENDAADAAAWIAAKSARTIGIRPRVLMPTEIPK